ncbi:hypothetical protein [Ruania zhangjianzhongii]|uniref:hypothetical protein n=1 Tax=Ruania zhangjianzhongii TaxID=2603206 RepID=UPI0011CB61D9|nr:hypothetical protein [Ruania zhangjianzhongii]
MMPTRTPQTLDDVAGYFRHARGEQADEDWARAAAARLVLDDVREPLIREALFEVVPVLEDAQEPAETLFGDAIGWAKERQADWRSDGVPASAPSGPRSVRAFVHGTFFGAAAATPAFALLRMFADGWTLDFTLILVIFPLLLSVGVLGFLALWNWLVRRRARGTAIAVTALALIGFSAAVAGGFALSHEEVLWRGSGFWLFAVAAGYGLLAAGTRWIWPELPPPDPDHQVEGDLAWKRLLAASLRERGDITEGRLKVIIADAERHSAQSQRSLAEEFGSPASYAARFAPDVAVRARRTAWGWTAVAIAPIAVFVLYGLEDGWHWQARFLALGLWFAGAAVAAATSWRRATGQAAERF